MTDQEASKVLAFDRWLDLRNSEDIEGCNKILIEFFSDYSLEKVGDCYYLDLANLRGSETFISSMILTATNNGFID